MRFFRFFIVVALVLGGCQGASTHQDSGRQALATKAPRLTKSDNQRVVSRDLKGVDPLQAHMRARRRVNPNDRSSKRSYTRLAHNGDQYRSRSVVKKSSVSQVAVVPIPVPRPNMRRGVAQQAPAVQVVRSTLSSSVPIPMVKPRQGARSAPRASVSAGKHHITNMRIGNHSDKTRIVFDVDAPVVAEIETSQNGRVLYITFNDTGWDIESAKVFPRHRLLSGYEARSSGQNSIVKIEMNRPVRVSGPKRYPPNAKYNNHRISIDVLG